jgi:transposase-like protein
MPRKPNPYNPPCVRCGHPHTVRDGGTREDRQRWLCRACGRTFGPTTGTPVSRRWTTPTWSRLRTSPPEVARALLVVRERGTLAAAEEETGHRYETIGRWLRAIADPNATDYAQKLTEALAHEFHLSESEIDAFWAFVRAWRPRAGRGVASVLPGMSADRDARSPDNRASRPE